MCLELFSSAPSFTPHVFLAPLPLSGWQQADLSQQTLRKQKKKIKLLVVACAAINRKSEDSQEKDTHNSDRSLPETGKKTTVIALWFQSFGHEN